MPTVQDVGRMFTRVSGVSEEENWWGRASSLTLRELGIYVMEKLNRAIKSDYLAYLAFSMFAP